MPFQWEQAPLLLEALVEYHIQKKFKVLFELKHVCYTKENGSLNDIWHKFFQKYKVHQVIRVLVSSNGDFLPGRIIPVGSDKFSSPTTESERTGVYLWNFFRNIQERFSLLSNRCMNCPEEISPSLKTNKLFDEQKQKG